MSRRSAVSRKTYEHLGVTVIVTDPSEKKILLGIRKNSYRAGMYGCPGGRLELAEPLEQTARRELLEETGLTAKRLKFVGTVREFQTTYNFIHFTFVADEYTGTVRTMEPDKCSGWNWFPLDALPENVLPGHAAGIRLLTDPLHSHIADIT